MCMALYFGVGCLWAYYAYFAFGKLPHDAPCRMLVTRAVHNCIIAHAAGDKLFKQGQIPVFKDMWEQMKV